MSLTSSSTTHALMASAAPATTWGLIMMYTVEPLLKGHLSTTATSYGTHGQPIHNNNVTIIIIIIIIIIIMTTTTTTT